MSNFEEIKKSHEEHMKKRFSKIDGVPIRVDTVNSDLSILRCNSCDTLLGVKVNGFGIEYNYCHHCGVRLTEKGDGDV